MLPDIADELESPLHRGRKNAGCFGTWAPSADGTHAGGSVFSALLAGYGKIVWLVRAASQRLPSPEK